MFSTKGLTIMTLLATVMVIGVVVLQVLEINYYAAPPSLWP